MARKHNAFEDSAILNNSTYSMWFNRLYGVAINAFEWQGLPDSVDERYLEKMLFWYGQAIWFKDDVLNKELCLQCVPAGEFDIYGYPIRRQAASTYNGYINTDLNESNSVIIYNNRTRTPDLDSVILFAKRLYECERTIDVNIKNQKTPGLIVCDEKTRLSLKNVYMQYDGNMPVIFANRTFDPNQLQYISTGAPYLVDKLQMQKGKYYSEALTYLGYESNVSDKRERMLASEIMTNLGVTESNRTNRLTSRQEAAAKISKMFNREVTVRFRSDLQLSQYTENMDKAMAAMESGELVIDDVTGEVITDE